MNRYRSTVKLLMFCAFLVNITQAYGDGTVVSSPVPGSARATVAQLNEIPNPGPAACRMPWYVYYPSYRVRVGIMQAYKVEEGDILFLGDSLTEWNDWQSAFKMHRVHNYGISGDTSFGLLARLGQITNNEAPSRVFLLIGTNELYSYESASADEVLATISEILKQLRTAFPGSELYVQGIMPRQREWGEKIRLFNARLGTLAAQHRVGYIDTWSALVDDTGALRQEYTIDELHLNEEGKRVWMELLRPYVEPVPGSRS